MKARREREREILERASRYSTHTLIEASVTAVLQEGTRRKVRTQEKKDTDK